MDNKLSEPSDNITDTLNSLRGWKQLAEAAEKRISALLAELEAKDKRIANLEFEQGGYGYSVLEDLNGKIKRIAELEAIATEYAGKFQKAQDAAKHLIIMNDSAQAEIAHLKTLLATPVRLPDIRSDDYHETGWFQHMKYYRDVERAISAAGFKCVGDE